MNTDIITESIKSASVNAVNAAAESMAANLRGRFISAESISGVFDVIAFENMEDGDEFEFAIDGCDLNDAKVIMAEAEEDGITISAKDVVMVEVVITRDGDFKMKTKYGEGEKVEGYVTESSLNAMGNTTTRVMYDNAIFGAIKEYVKARANS